MSYYTMSVLATGLFSRIWWDIALRGVTQPFVNPLHYFLLDVKSK